MLIASRRTIVGEMNIHAIARSESPRKRAAIGLGVRAAALSMSVPTGRDSSIQLTLRIGMPFVLGTLLPLAGGGKRTQAGKPFGSGDRMPPRGRAAGEPRGGAAG